MSDFSQNGIISTLHDFGTKSLEQIEKEKTISLIKKNGFFEYYSFKTGKAFGASNFSWTASLFLDLILEKEYN